ncbi:hypothetical protein E2P47_03920 [Candidatus Bathyarchaeota archaeon]|nr:hypothetical protein E2P47_03920 [Candidatus Bathyarchaeota archaeon]
MSKKKKKSWKEQQRDRQLKEQKAENTFQQQRKNLKKTKPRNWSKIIIISSIIIISIVIASYFIFQNPASEPFYTIHIKSDGSIDPQEVPIVKSDDTHYTLTGNIHGSIIIEKDNIILDGANHILFGNNKVTSKGLEISEKNQITIKNLEIKNFDTGIHLFISSNNIITENTLSDNKNSIWLEYSSNNQIINNRFSKQFALSLASSSYNQISKNTIQDCEGAIGLSYSSDNTIIENNITNSTSAIGLVSYSSNNTISENFLLNCDGGIALSSYSSDNEIHDNTLKTGLGGLGFSSFSMKNHILRNQIESFDQGIILSESPTNLFEQNSISNCAAGITLSYSLNNTFTENNIVNSQQLAISLTYSEDNYFYHNIFSENSEQVFTSNSLSYWDNGYPSGGNYWSDYEEKYPNAEEIESSGIWNEPYEINESEYDNFPLMSQPIS